eukprot:781367-Prorocentrum_minimum.AAC.1
MRVSFHGHFSGLFIHNVPRWKPASKPGPKVKGKKAPVRRATKDELLTTKLRTLDHPTRLVYDRKVNGGKRGVGASGKLPTTNKRMKPGKKPQKKQQPCEEIAAALGNGGR